jgi:hypothetical protein
MAEKNIIMQRKKADGTFDQYYPQTKVDGVLGGLTLVRGSKDAEGIYTVLEFKRVDGTLFKKSTLSGGTSPEYTTRTVQYYAANGTTIVQTITYALTYSDGELDSEVIQQ